ncbi:MAG: SusC/RagA family TonB-linked outer membrane protein [Bacteroides sp.]|nr:SusC/RagA family TonB-linked outer membrane protein [Bacteroides sp.]
MKTKLILAFLLLFTVNAFAQTRSVSGTVYDSSTDEPLVGATVKVKGTKIATSTDIDGRFVLQGLTNSDKHLEVSYVGYEPKTVEIKPDLKIYLTSTTSDLDEMIVVAFGKQKRESFTGSASVIDAEQIARAQVTNPIEALNGTVTGLSMIETNSFTSDPTITIRGVGSINAGTAPLIVLDGMPYNGYWNDINPADVASITVLKDAASNALYGARGANGVILITSKSAQRGKTKVNFNAKWGSNHDAREKYNVIDNAGEYYEAFYLAQKNYFMNTMGQDAALAHLNANNAIGLPYSSGGLGYVVYTVPQGELLIGSNGKLNPNATLGNRVEYNGEIYTLYPDNWENLGLRDGFRQEYNLTLSSGSDRYTMYASLGYLDANGLAYGNDIERYTARLKADAQAYSFLKVGASAAYNHTKTHANENIFNAQTSMSPIYPAFIRDAQGNIMYDSHGKMYDYGNATLTGLYRAPDQSGNYIQEDLLDVAQNVSNAFQIQGYGTLDFLDGFHFTLNGSTYLTENRFNYAYNPYYGYNTGGSVSVYHYRTVSFNTQQLLNYNKVFGDHSLDVLLGHEYTRNGSTNLQGSRNKVALYDTNKELAGAITDASMNSYTSDYNVEGWFIRAQYDFAGKYFGSASFRRDGSSRFHPKHRWGNFWSVGAAWIATKEEWFPQSDIVNMLKLKVSYGEQGNDAIGNFRYTNRYDIRNVDGDPSFVFTAKGNETITWETVGSINAGIEFELFNSRLSGGVEFYSRTTRDMLTFFSTPVSIGYTGYYDNVGNMRNTGLEVQLDANVLSVKNFSWNIGLNLSWENNRVTYLPEEKKLVSIDGHPGYLSGDFYYGEGLPVNTWRLKKYAGVNDEGRALFYFTKDNGELGTTTSYQDGDYYLCGSSLPDVFGGFNTSFKIFDFDINAQFNYSIGGKKYDSVYAYMMTPPYGTLTGYPIHRDAFKAWTTTNTNSDIPIYEYDYYDPTNTSDRFLTDASYISLRNITIGYNFPKSVLRKLHMESLRVFCQAENIYYWSKRKGYDPRMGENYGNYNSDSGYSYPMRTISGGLSVEF